MQDIFKKNQLDSVGYLYVRRWRVSYIELQATFHFLRLCLSEVIIVVSFENPELTIIDFEYTINK